MDVQDPITRPPAARKRGAARFRERAELLDFLLEVSTITAETLDLDQLLGSVASVVHQVLPYDLYSILLYSDKSKTLRIRHAIGHREELICNLELKLGEGIVGTAAETRKPVRVDDVRSDERYLNALDAVQSELAAPMMARGRLVGVIDLQSTSPKRYNEQDQAMLTLIASRIGASIDNARLHRRVERTNRTLRTLTALAQEFSSILDLDQLLGRIAVAIRGLINFDAFSVLLLDESGENLRHRFSLRYDQRVELDNIAIGKGITGYAAQNREAVLVRDISDDPRYIPGHPDIRSEVVVPLIVKDRVIGVLDLEHEQVGFFTEDHLRTLTLLAPQTAISIENARLYEEVERRKKEMEDDLKAARRLQRILLPREAPEIHGLKIAVRFRPAREVSGDIYDFFEHGDNYALIAFGDSSGKGAAAAIYGAVVSGMLRSFGPRRRGPGALLQALNEVLIERKVDAQYVTLLMLLWNEERCEMTLANAGAIPPLVCRDGKVFQPMIEGVPLGLLEDRTYEELVVPLKSGDTVVLHSDGFQDQPDAQDRQFGECCLHQLIPKLCGGTPKEIADALFDALDKHRGELKMHDDQTLIVFQVH